MLRAIALGTMILSICASAYASPTVDCDAGQSVNRTLAKMNKFIPTTITIKGTCIEYVQIDGFNDLTINGVQGATLQQPNTNPQNNSYVLSIRASRSITVSGLAVHSLPTIFSSIGIGRGSSDIRLQNVTTDGSGGVVIYDESQVWLVNVTVNITAGYAAIAVFDKSDVHIVDGLLERPANGNFNAGLLVAGHVTIQGMTIRDMQLGIAINSSGAVDSVNFEPTTTGTDVIIDNPSGTNINGAIVSDGSSLNVGSAKLRIINAGQPSGGETAAIFINDGSTLGAGSNLVVSGSQGQGVIVSNNSHARLSGSSITGSVHGGLVVVNFSTATADTMDPPTVIGGNGTDLFCDSKSQIAGGLNIAGASTQQCNNFLPGKYENLP